MHDVIKLNIQTGISRKLKVILKKIKHHPFSFTVERSFKLQVTHKNQY